VELEYDVNSPPTFRVVNRALIRADYKLRTERCGTVEPGELLAALEIRVAHGQMRVRFARGWVSELGPDGSPILEQLPAGGGSEPLIQPLADGAGVRYKVVNRAFVRVGFELTSQRRGTVEPGEYVVAMTTRTNADQTVRVQFERGWVSMTGPDGSPVLAVVEAAGDGEGNVSAAVRPELLSGLLTGDTTGASDDWAAGPPDEQDWGLGLPRPGGGLELGTSGPG
jgi:hypothetical protein